MDYRERWELKDYLIGQTLERRIVLFHVGLILVFLGFLLNFWYLQAVHGQEYAHLAENNRLRRIPLLPTRGVIFDRRGEVVAATRPALDLVLRREGALDVDAELRRLAPILSMPYEKLVERVERLKHRPLYEPLVLKEDVDLGELARIEARRELFPSLEVQQNAHRNYPHGKSFAHLLGYVGEVSEAQLSRRPDTLRLGDIVGQTGLERGYDERLRGTRGWNLVSVNSMGRQMDGPWVGREPVHGRTLRLTLDRRLQEVLESTLSGEVGAGVFLDPWTGEVLALVSTPGFDPNQFSDGMTRSAWQSILEDSHRPLHNRAVASFYAPGSVFKVVMAAVGLETGAITADDTVYCGGSTTPYDRRRLCWKRGGHGQVDLRRALAHSCNVYFYLLGKKAGIDAIQRYGEKFALGRPTGIDLPGEAAGILPSPEWKRRHLGEYWYPGDTISVAIGQGYLAVTPAQMATMIGAVGTGGRLVRPHVVQGRRPEAVELDLSPETFRVIQLALRDAVEEGTGRKADVKGVAVAGKTGTAQIFRHSAGVDSDRLPKEERDHAWFVGYAPADRPQVAFAVVVEHGGHGGATAAPVARRVLELFFSEELDGDNRIEALGPARDRPPEGSDARSPAAG